MKSRFPLAKRSTEFCSRVHGSNVALYAVRTYDVWSPNIVGEFYIRKAGYFGNTGNDSYGTGPFSARKEGQGHSASETANVGTVVSFDASDSNDIYAGQTVQSASLCALVCIKI